MGKVMRHTLGASLNIRHNVSSSKGPKPLQLKVLTTYIPKTSAFTLAFFFFNDTATTEIYTLSLHDALPILRRGLVPGERNDFQAPRRVWWLEIAEDTAARL